LAVSQKINIMLGSGLDLSGEPYVWMTVNELPTFRLTPEISRALGQLHTTCSAEAEEDAAVFRFVKAEFGQRYRAEERMAVIEKLREFRQKQREEKIAAPVPQMATPPGGAPTAEEVAAAREVFQRAGIAPVLSCSTP
jgi:hypothetical protein